MPLETIMTIHCELEYFESLMKPVKKPNEASQKAQR